MALFSLTRFTLFTICIFQVLSVTAYAQDRAWEMLDELDVAAPTAPPVRGTMLSEGAPAQYSPPPQILSAAFIPGPRKADAIKANMTAGEVRTLLGDPDSITSSQLNQEESWVYGKSLLFFHDQRLSGWSDAGDLGSRAVAHLVSAPQKEKKVEFSEDGWKNAWQRESKPNAGDVVDELIQIPDSIVTEDHYSSLDSAVVSPNASSEAIEGSFPKKSSSN